MSTALPVSSIRLDHALQSRAVIDPATVSEYAEAMAGGASFPPLDVYVIDGKHVVADGFHRFLAHQQNGDATIPVIVHPGGREAAVRHALGANAKHGLKRTNADKRRAVEIALKEFAGMSDRAIAEMCGVSHVFVSSVRPKEVVTVTTDTAPQTRVGKDGVSQPATKPKTPKVAEEDAPTETNTEATPERSISFKPSNGLQYARMAISQLEKIESKDTERDEAFALVLAYLKKHDNATEAPASFMKGEYAKHGAQITVQLDRGDPKLLSVAPAEFAGNHTMSLYFTSEADLVRLIEREVSALAPWKRLAKAVREQIKSQKGAAP